MPMYLLVHATAALVLAVAQPTPSPSPSPSPSSSPSPSPTPDPNAYDAEAFGSTHRAKVGEVVEVSFGVRNHGPGITPPQCGTCINRHHLVLAVPPGTELLLPVPIHELCAARVPPTKDGMSCVLDSIGVGQSLTLSVRVQVNQAQRNATGTVSRNFRVGGDRDINHANDSADVVIDSGESLPQTGPNITGLVTTGIGSIAAGGLLLFALRRRRIRSRAATG